MVCYSLFVVMVVSLHDTIHIDVQGNRNMIEHASELFVCCSFSKIPLNSKVSLRNIPELEVMYNILAQKS